MEEDDDDAAIERIMADYLAKFSIESLDVGAERIKARITPEISVHEREARLDLLRMIAATRRRKIN